MSNRTHVLVVDDDSNALSILSRYLKKYNFQTIMAKNGPLGLRKFKENSEDIGLIVTDMQMPMMSGEEFIREINKIDDDIPIIIFSGTGLDFSHLEDVSNVKSILEKPINYNKFHVVAKQYFKQA